ncbi:MAG: c-type cytochrome [Betaproteobacteria bacterium]|nr:c-type cytochrome [Betaproteobacteria bacterium]
MKKILIVAATAAVLALPSMAHAKGNAAAGAKKADACKACHGEAGAKPIQADYPVLAGQHYDYLVAALNQYKSGKRKNASMNGFAAALKPEDIRDLAAYFSAQSSDLKMKY